MKPCNICADGSTTLVDENGTSWYLACPYCVGYITGNKLGNNFPILNYDGYKVENDCLEPVEQ